MKAKYRLEGAFKKDPGDGENLAKVRCELSLLLGNMTAGCQDEEDEDDGLLHDSDILDIDKAELLLGRDLDMFSSSEEAGEGEAGLGDSTGSSLGRARPLSAYRRTDK